MESIPVEPELLARANWWFDVSWYGLLVAGIATAVAACTAVVFLFLQFWSSGVREKHSDWRTAELEFKSKEATAEFEKAHAEIASANAEAAKANERTELLKAQVAWRVLTIPQYQRIVADLRGVSGPMGFIWEAGDPEAVAYSRMLGKALSDSGFKLARTATMGADMAYGVLVLGEKSETRERLEAALRKAGVQFSMGEFKGGLRVRVGSKIPPF